MLHALDIAFIVVKIPNVIEKFLHIYILFTNIFHAVVGV